MRQVAEQAKRKAEQYEEGELSEDSSENKETVPTEDDTLVLSPGIQLEVKFLDMFAKMMRNVTFTCIMSYLAICWFACMEQLVSHPVAFMQLCM